MTAMLRSQVSPHAPVYQSRPRLSHQRRQVLDPLQHVGMRAEGLHHLSWKLSLVVLDRQAIKDMAGVETRSLALPPLTD